MTDDPAPHAPRLRWDAEALRACLEPLLPGVTVEVAPRAASTSTELLERARRGAAPADGRAHVAMAPCLLVAEQQTAGRGRLGRAWRSSAGASLTFSLALPLAPADWSGLSLAVGVALAEALQPDLPAPGAPRLAVKWPNDLWLLDAAAGSGDAAAPGRKLGGVLIETLVHGSGRVAVVGVGLNVLPLPPSLAGTLDEPVACLREIDPAATAPAALARVAAPLAAALREFERAGHGAFAARFAARDLLRDRAVSTTQPGVPAGIARGVDAHGALRVETPDGRLHLVGSGEVSVRPHGLAGDPRRAPRPADDAAR